MFTNIFILHIFNVNWTIIHTIISIPFPRGPDLLNPFLSLFLATLLNIKLSCRFIVRNFLLVLSIETTRSRHFSLMRFFPRFKVSTPESSIGLQSALNPSSVIRLPDKSSELTLYCVKRRHNYFKCISVIFLHFMSMNRSLFSI